MFTLLTLKMYFIPSLISSTSSWFAKHSVERICPLKKGEKTQRKISTDKEQKPLMREGETLTSLIYEVVKLFNFQGFDYGILLLNLETLVCAQYLLIKKT